MRHIAFLLVMSMLLSFCIFGVPTAAAESWLLPEGTPMFEPGCVVELDFGTFMVQDAGFAKEITYLSDHTTGTPPQQMTNGYMAGTCLWAFREAALASIEPRSKIISPSALSALSARVCRESPTVF